MRAGWPLGPGVAARLAFVACLAALFGLIYQPGAPAGEPPQVTAAAATAARHALAGGTAPEPAFIANHAHAAAPHGGDHGGPLAVPPPESAAPAPVPLGATPRPAAQAPPAAYEPSLDRLARAPPPSPGS